MKKRIFHLLHPSHRNFDTSWFIDLFLIVLILLNVVCIMLESVPSLQKRYAIEFRIFDTFSVVVFTIEYLLRVWTANVDPRYADGWRGTLRYLVTPMALVDLLAILPFYLPFLGIDLRLLRALRVIRVFRLFKLARYLKALSFLGRVLHNKKEELTISFVFAMFLLVVSSALMYFVEHEKQPEKFSSIPETMWWSIVTLTTVGYGDVTPVTAWGKIFGGCIALSGIAVLALPVSILAGGFTDELARTGKEQLCPHCGKPVNGEEKNKAA